MVKILLPAAPPDALVISGRVAPGYSNSENQNTAPHNKVNKNIATHNFA